MLNLYASDNYAVAVEKGKTYVYKDGKKLNSTAFYEVDPVEVYVETPEPDYPGQITYRLHSRQTLRLGKIRLENPYRRNESS